MIRTNLAWLCASAIILMSPPGFADETSATGYWYGGALHPLVVTRDGVNHRLIGKSVVETLAGSEPTRSYAYADRLGSVRMVTDDRGQVRQRLSYDDYGSTRIEGQNTAATDDSMASFYRFQGQEQEIFPLLRLASDDEALASWLDRLQLYHFPWRDYGASLAAFSQTDPVPRENSFYAALGANPVNITDETGGIAVLDDLDTRTQDLLYAVRSNGGVFLTSAERRHLWSILQQVRAETPERLEEEVLIHLSFWENGVVAYDSHRQVKLQMLDSPEKRASYQQFREKWLSVHERLIEKLFDTAEDATPIDLFQSTTPEAQAPSPQVSAATRQGSPVLRPEAQQEDEKAVHEVKADTQSATKAPE